MDQTILPPGFSENTLLEQERILPKWDAPGNIKSLVTTRQGGWSKAPFDSFNLATHVDDDGQDVKKNRQKLANALPSEPVWLNQVHSNVVVNAGSAVLGTDADGSYTTQPNMVSVVLTADCLPVLICTRQGDGVAALHAGWRGLLNGILEQGVAKLLKATRRKPEDLLIWFGPAIGPDNFEVGEEVRQEFLHKAQDKSQTAQCFVPAKNNTKQNKANHVKEYKWFADIYQLARLRLLQTGVENFSGGNYCSYRDKEKFYSFRRDGKTGRMASLIWIEKS